MMNYIYFLCFLMFKMHKKQNPTKKIGKSGEKKFRPFWARRAWWSRDPKLGAG
jgi:hypothetical protein